MKDTTAAIIIICIIMLPVLFEVGLLTYAYVNADRVSCNFLWCTFTTEKQTQNSTSYRECYMNGKKINCSEEDWNW